MSLCVCFIVLYTKRIGLLTCVSHPGIVSITHSLHGRVHINTVYDSVDSL